MNDDEFDFDAALRLLLDSDARWQPPPDVSGGDSPQRRTLDRFANVLARMLQRPPRWLETITHPVAQEAGEIEVRVLGEQALYLVSSAWASQDAEVSPVVRVRPLRDLRALDVDGFEFDEADRPTGWTITLLFTSGDSVRLGSSAGADRSHLTSVLPALLERIGV